MLLKKKLRQIAKYLTRKYSKGNIDQTGIYSIYYTKKNLMVVMIS